MAGTPASPVKPVSRALAGRKWLKRGLAVLLGVAVLLGYRKLIPVYRVEVRSELVMLGDLDGDHHWSAADLALLETFLADPFSFSDSFAQRVDLNQNGRLDAEDVRILTTLAAHPDPYQAEEAARGQGAAFPRPRELYRYESVGMFRPRPLWALPAPAPVPSLSWMQALSPGTGQTGYSDRLEADLYNESIRFQEAFRKRQPGLNPLEQDYARAKLAQAQAHFQQGARYDLLLDLIGLVEDAETLTATPDQDKIQQLLHFRDHLQQLLLDPLFERFRRGEVGWRELLKVVEQRLQDDLGLEYRLETLGPPRNLTHLDNYFQRAVWQYYKTSTRSADFVQLLEYAEHDPRYLRAVARTSRKHGDPEVLNHNLPMVLLFREALRIRGGDKRRAVGLLDEAIRIPFAWIKAIPRDKLPGSLALDNFLLPGNKEDGSDKSRHWNVFGGICLYKSPEEALDLAIKREMKDLREGGYTPAALEEFLRDMIANLNGMYYVLAINPNLLAKRAPSALDRASPGA